MSVISRRLFAAAAAIVLTSLALPVVAGAQSQPVTKDLILNDPAAPVGGNPDGKLTIVAFMDYNCPYCKVSAPALNRIVREDHDIRLVYKDWPVIRATSMDGAQLALAAKYQGRYVKAHDAMMAIPGSHLTRAQMLAALRKAGIDMTRLQSDLKTHRRDIDALIASNGAQADALGLTGTPTFLIGGYRAATLDYNGFVQAVARARAAPQ
ncbi:DsbA family protein [Asticcacaulis sp. EMRT-3]|uniref:DsbA family protein n=1 Tax=Asticcacaulis sp. EMRT-3 TaxID=3040349 RepID=UPI0024AE9F55|nr:DsbA family protein [Asticcacaulis sp. EMRT-3]MDI7776627.1 DsbA family protein [Asticcacaulis sp. EMRT-3]